MAGYAAGPFGLGAGVWKYDWDPRDDTAEPVIVRVRVTDDYSPGQAEATATVTVRNVAPIVDAGPDADVAARRP